MFVRMGAATLAAPFTSSLADRYPRERVMFFADVIRVALLSAMAVAGAAGVPAAVYTFAVLSSITTTAFRPAEAALITQIARTPEELTAANVTSSTFDSIGAFAGPAVGAFAVALAGSGIAFAVVAAAFAWSLLFVARIGSQPRPEAAAADAEEARGLAAGVRAVRSTPRLALLLGVYGVQLVIGGAYGVLVVVGALEILDLGNAGVGYLQSATGVGAVLGGAVALALSARRRTASDLGLGLVLFGVPLVVIAIVPHTWAAIPALAVLGIGNSIVDISAITLIQRLVPPAVAGRVFGLLETTLVAALGLGALATPLLVHVLGARGAFAAAGAVLPVVALLTRRMLVAIDRSATAPEEQLQAIAVVPFLDVLPPERKEALADALERVELAAGHTLFSEGDRGDRLYILTDGALTIELPEGAKVEEAPAFVGEIALLRDVPRTATVRAARDATLWALDGEHFLDTIAGHARSRSAADAVVTSRGFAVAG
jgi:MFS family permease